MSRSKTIILPIVFLFFTTITVGVWLDQRLTEASEQTCAVYQGFYKQFPETDAIFFEGVSSSYTPFPSDRVPHPPTQFKRDTGEFEMVELAPNMELFERSVRETFEQDTTEFFSAVAEGKPQSIKNCFGDMNEPPGIFTGLFDVLFTREIALGRGDRGFVTLWTVSPVGFSENGQSAIIYAGSTCGGLCGWDGFVLFEKKGGEWVVAGDKWLWVS